MVQWRYPQNQTALRSQEVRCCFCVCCRIQKICQIMSGTMRVSELYFRQLCGKLLREGRDLQTQLRDQSKQQSTLEDPNPCHLVEKGKYMTNENKLPTCY